MSDSMDMMTYKKAVALCKPHIEAERQWYAEQRAFFEQNPNGRFTVPYPEPPKTPWGEDADFLIDRVDRTAQMVMAALSRHHDAVMITPKLAYDLAEALEAERQRRWLAEALEAERQRRWDD